jgi:uncharacterized protein
MSASRPKAPVVDCHALVGKGTTWATPAREVDYDPNELLDCASEAGIDKLCVLSPRTSDYPAANRKIAEICERHQNKFIGVAVHSPQHEAGRIRQTVIDEVRSMGLQAVRSDGHPTRELLDTAAVLNIPVIYYPDQNSTPGPARWYHIMASTYSSVRFILPHLGQYCSRYWWAHMEALDLVRRYPNVYLDTSGIGSVKYLEMAVKELPADRILFASFAPELDPRVGVETIRLVKLPAESSTKVLGENITALLRNVVHAG